MAFIAGAPRGFAEVQSHRGCEGSVPFLHEGGRPYQMFVIGRAGGAGKQTDFSWREEQREIIIVSLLGL